MRSNSLTPFFETPAALIAGIGLLLVPLATLWLGLGAPLTVGALAVALIAAAAALRGFLGRCAELQAKLAGVAATRMVIEYLPDGTIVAANEPFCKLLGYRLEDLVGRHHRIFVDRSYGESAEYREFWARLGRGEFIEQRFKRQAAGGRDIWVMTNYVPVFNAAGKVVKVVNWMTDLTESHLEQAAVVDALAGGLHALAGGKLTTQLTAELKGEYETMRHDLNAALQHMLSTMKSVQHGSVAIASGTSEIATAVDDLARRTEQQAAGLEQASSALEEITATMQKTAVNAREVFSTTNTAKKAALEGATVVEDTIAAMEKISQSSKQITDIIGVIDEIAFQTNLLALNAGVEAARAGEAGRGFAVVASEVRTLAQRSGEAAKQIRSLIHTSREQVDAGVKSVGDSGAALKRIAGNVESIASLVEEMVQATDHQSVGIGEVHQAVAQMDQVTQKNAAMVEETATALRSLAGEADKLSDEVAFFEVGQPVRAAAAIRARAA